MLGRKRLGGGQTVGCEPFDAFDQRQGVSMACWNRACDAKATVAMIEIRASVSRRSRKGRVSYRKRERRYVKRSCKEMVMTLVWRLLQVGKRWRSTTCMSRRWPRWVSTPPPPTKGERWCTSSCLELVVRPDRRFQSPVRCIREVPDMDLAGPLREIYL